MRRPNVNSGAKWLAILDFKTPVVAKEHGNLENGRAGRSTRASAGDPEFPFMNQRSLFHLLSAGLEITIRNANPWWRDESIADVPAFQRWAFEPVYTRLTRGLAPAIVLSGPRQVGKTTLL